MRYPKAYHEACLIQRRLLEATESMSVKDLGNLAKAYVSLEQLKLRIRMKPAPKAIDTTKLPSKDKPLVQPSFTE